MCVSKHLRWSFFVNILNGSLFSQYKLHHRCSTGLGHIKTYENVEIFRVNQLLKSSQLLQRVAFLANFKNVNAGWDIVNWVVQGKL